jgi:hypothetical protein
MRISFSRCVIFYLFYYFYYFINFGEMDSDRLKMNDVMFFQKSEAVFQKWTF